MIPVLREKGERAPQQKPKAVDGTSPRVCSLKEELSRVTEVRKVNAQRLEGRLEAQNQPEGIA